MPTITTEPAREIPRPAWRGPRTDYPRDPAEADRLRRESSALANPRPTDSAELLAARTGGGTIEICQKLFRLQALVDAFDARISALDARLAKLENR
jgi:hypothetical protein